MENVKEIEEVVEEVEVVEEEATKFDWFKGALMAAGGVVLGIATKVLFDKITGSDDEDEEELEMIEAMEDFENEDDDEIIEESKEDEE